MMRKGKLIHEGKPDEIIHSIDGKVWECQVPNTEAPALRERYNISNLRSEGDMTMLRIVNDAKPLKSAIPATPNLEDLYLYYFNEEGKTS